MTYPLIGNYGRLIEDDQSLQPWLRALVVANATAAVVDDVRQLAALLRDQGIPAIAGVDTRALARHLRANGSLRGIVTEPGFVDRDAAVERARAVPRWEDQDFVGQVSPASIMDVGSHDEGGPLIAIVDFGLKSNIVRGMRRRGARVRILPHTISTAVALARDIDGVILSPGPGDPGPTRRAGRAGAGDHRRWPAAARDLPRPPDRGAGGGRRDAPAAVRASRREPPGPRRRPGAGPGDRPEPRGPGGRGVLPRESGFRVSQVNLNDGSVEGLRHATKPIETVQYHPEGAPGPLDALAVFDRFVAAAEARRG